MKLIILLLLFLSSHTYAAVAFFSHSNIVGLNRVCVYMYAGTEYHINVPTNRMCPIRITV